VLSQGEPRDAAVNFNRYRILQRHRAVALPQHGFLVLAYISDRSSAEITQSALPCSVTFVRDSQSHKSQPEGHEFTTRNT